MDPGFLLNQSVSYVVALVTSFFEYGVIQRFINYYEILVSPINYIIIGFGLTMILVGHYFRVAAEFTAGANFNHKI